MASYIPRGDISPNRIKTFLECRKKFKLMRAKGSPKSLPNRYKRIGSLVHEALYQEGRGRIGKWMGFKAKDAPVSGEDLTRHLMKSVKAMDDPARISEIQEAREILEQVAELIDFSNTSLVEEKWECLLAPIVGPKAVGVFDLVSIKGQPGAEDHVLIDDYKTGFNMLSSEDFADDIQAGLYVVAARDRYPKARRITIRFRWLELGPSAVLSAEWSKDLDDSVRAHAIAIHKLMTEAKDTDKEAGTPGTWACSDCPFKPSCSEYQAWEKAGVTELRTNMTDEELLAGRERNATLANGATAEKSAFDTLIQMRLKNNLLEAGGLKAKLVVKAIGYEEAGLAETIDVIDDVTSLGSDQLLAILAGLDKRNLKTFLESLKSDERERVEAELRNRRRLKSGTSYIDVRRVAVKKGKAVSGSEG